MFELSKAQPINSLINRAAQWISRVSEPLILVGSGIAQGNTRHDLIKLATQLCIPIVSTVSTEGVIPQAHPLLLGTVDSSRAHIRYGFDWADLVIAVGCDGETCTAHDWNPDGDIPILHVGTTPANPHCHYQPKIELVGNLAELLQGILQQANRDTKPTPYCLDTSDRGQIKVQSLSPKRLGDCKSYTLQSSDQTILMKVSGEAIKHLFVHHFRTSRLHALQGTAVLVVMQDNSYEYLVLSDQKPTTVEIPPGIPHGIINLNAESCLIMNSIIHHGPADERDSYALKPPFPYDIARALQLLRKNCGWRSQRPALKAL